MKKDGGGGARMKKYIEGVTDEEGSGGSKDEEVYGGSNE